MSTTQVTQSDTPVSQDVVNAVMALHTALHKEFGCDFAYTIMGRGHVVAASNMELGLVAPYNPAGESPKRRNARERKRT